jgi:hypothetical protein
MTEGKMILQLSRDEALVLFEWVSRFNKTRTPAFEDQAEERVLWDLEARRESALVEPFRKDYARTLAGLVPGSVTMGNGCCARMESSARCRKHTAISSPTAAICSRPPCAPFATPVSSNSSAMRPDCHRSLRGAARFPEVVDQVGHTNQARRSRPLVVGADCAGTAGRPATSSSRGSPNFLNTVALLLCLLPVFWQPSLNRVFPVRVDHCR